MAIELFGFVSVPAVDDGTNTADPTAITPPADMQRGDLVLLYGLARSTGLTLTISEAGGQTWTNGDTRNQTFNSARTFWCVFDGTWDANPSIAFGATTCNSVVMLVFRPNGGTASTWEQETSSDESGNYAAPADPYTVTLFATVPATTTVTDGALVVANWTSTDNNTWGNLVGETHTWTALSQAQFRNSSGSDSSQTFAWMIDAAAGSTGKVSQDQLTLGGDAGTRSCWSWREVAAASGVTVNADIGTGTFATLTPTVTATGGVTVTPAPISALFSTIAPAIRVAVLTVAQAIAGLFSPLVPAISASALVSPAPISGQFAAIDGTVIKTGGATVAPSAIDGAFSVASNPSATGDSTFVAMAAASWFLPIDPMASTVSLQQPDPIAGAFESIAPTVRASAVVSPEPTAGTFATLAPTVSIAGMQSANVTPDAIAGTFSTISIASISGTAKYIPAPIAGTFTPINGTASSAAGVTVSPSPITGTFSIASTPAVSVSATYSLMAAAGWFGATDPSVILPSAEVTVTPSPIAGTFATLAPTLLGGALPAQFDTPGSASWTCPSDVNFIKIHVWGPGAVGGNGSTGGGGGGAGSGGYSYRESAVTPGQNYTVFVGAPGQQSYFSSASHTMARSGEDGGDADGEGPGSAGAGAAVGVGSTTYPGANGQAGQALALGGDGGDAPSGGNGGAGGDTGLPGGDGEAPGGGGGGGGKGAGTGGAGANGRVLLEALTGYVVVNPEPVSGTFTTASSPVIMVRTIYVPDPVTGRLVPTGVPFEATVLVEPISGTFEVSDFYDGDVGMLVVPIENSGTVANLAIGQIYKTSSATVAVNPISGTLGVIDTVQAASATVNPQPIEGLFEARPASITAGSATTIQLNAIGGSFSLEGPATSGGGNVTVDVYPVSGWFSPTDPAKVDTEAHYATIYVKVYDHWLQITGISGLTATVGVTLVEGGTRTTVYKDGLYYGHSDT